MDFSLWNLPNPDESPELDWRSAYLNRSPATSAPQMRLDPTKIVNVDPMTAIMPAGARSEPPPGFNPKDPRAFSKTGSTQSGIREITTQTPVVSQEEALRLAEGSDQIKQQRAGIDSLAKLAAANVAVPSQMDLTPILQLIDTWTGSKFANGYQKPRTAEDQAKLGFAYAKDIQDQRNKLADDLQALAKSNQTAGGLVLDKTTGKVGLSSEFGNKAESAPKGNPVTAANQFNKYAQSELKPFNDRINTIGQIHTEVAQGNPIDDRRIAILRASMDAHGRPNIAEVQMDAGDAAWVPRLEQAWDRVTKGTMTEHNRALMMQSLQDVLSYQNFERQKTIDRLRSQGALQYNQTPEQLGAAFPKSYTSEYGTGAPAGGKSRATLNSMAGGGQSAKDRLALDWANKNPTDHRAAKIKERLGVK